MSGAEKAPLLQSNDDVFSPVHSVNSFPDSRGEPGVFIGDGDSPNARMRFSAFNLANTIIGGGILSLPFAIKLAGIGLGGIILVILYLYGLFCLHLLIKTADLVGLSHKATFKDLAQAAYGKAGAWVTDVCVIFSCFGLMCSYLVIIADMLGPIIEASFPMDPRQIRTIVMCCSLVVLIPLSSMRHMNVLRFTSVAAVAAVLYTVVVVIYYSAVEIASGNIQECEGTERGCLDYFVFTGDFLQAISLVNLAFTCQMNFFTIYGELQNSNPRRMNKVSFRAMTVCLFLYALMGIFGYVNFRDQTEGNIMLNFEVDDPVTIVARLAIAIEIIFSFPIVAHPCISTFDEMVIRKPFTQLRRAAEAISFTGLALLIAIFVPDVSLIFSLSGATASNMISFILPAAFYLKLEGQEKWSSARRLVAASMVVLGIFFMVSSTTVIILNIGD